MKAYGRLASRVCEQAASPLPDGWRVSAPPSERAVPPGCRICEEPLTEPTRFPICDACLDSFKPISGRDLRRLRHARGNGGDAAMARFLFARSASIPKHRTYAFDRLRSWSFYEGAMVRAILLLKFENIEPLGGLFARLLAEMVARSGPQLEADVIVPVPLHRQRERERGYNQAALIAKPLAKMLAIAVQIGAADENSPAPGQTHPHFGRALGVRSWRFCHTSRQPD